LKKTILLAVFSLCVSLTASANESHKPLALVWGGKGVCKEGCETATAKMARMAGFQVQMVTKENFSQELLDKAVIWLQPGGNAIEASHDFGIHRIQMLRNFVARGGRYVGFCAGAFFSDTWVDDFNTVPGLGITPVVTADFAKESEVILEVNWEGRLRQIYFNTGGTFKLETRTPDVKVFAYYQTEGLPALPAAWENTFGEGRVVVTGTHPEAPPKWREDLNKVDQDGDDYDLALEMIQKAMAPRW
jgi:glutamine amidotransferase-like uncharacterized protein